jgi:hypothetical protein
VTDSPGPRVAYQHTSSTAQGSDREAQNGAMALVEALVVLGVVALIVYAAVVALGDGAQRGRPTTVVGARWEATHHAAGHTTRVVVRKVVPATGTVLDEHLVAVIPDEDPDYDANFLQAMAQARQRVALFESEDS